MNPTPPVLLVLSLLLKPPVVEEEPVVEVPPIEDVGLKGLILDGDDGGSGNAAEGRECLSGDPLNELEVDADAADGKARDFVGDTTWDTFVLLGMSSSKSGASAC